MAHKPLSKTLMVKCGYCDMEILDQNLRVHCRDKHNSVKFAAGSTHITSFFPPKSDHKRKLSSSSSDPKKLCVSNSESENQGSTSDSILNTEMDAPSPSEPDEQHIEPTLSISANADGKLDEILACVKDIQVSLKHSDGKSVTKPVLPPIAKPENVSPEHSRADKIQFARSLNDIIDSYSELSLHEGSDYGLVICQMCCNESSLEKTEEELLHQAGVMSFPVDMPRNFIDDDVDKQSRPFINLKKKIKTHLMTKTHISNWQAWQEREEENKQIESRNFQIGMRVGRICYYLYKKGGSERDFEMEVARKIQDGIDMGNINHSHNFLPKFRPCVAKEVSARMSKFLNSIMAQSGCLPPINIGADKGTSKHRTRQFITALIVIPDAAQVLQPVYVGQPVVKQHSGKGVALSIKNGLDIFGIVSTQLEGSSHDGQYFHLSVPEEIRTLYELDSRFVSTADPLHRAGTVDTHIRKDPTFEWMVKIFSTCKEIFNKFNWGKNHEMLIETCKEIEQNMAQLVTFQTTRFANSIRLVVINLRLDFEAVILCLQKIEESFAKSSDSKEVEKRNDAKRLRGAMVNKRFCLHLSGVADVYDIFGVLVNYVQKVNILPHERYDSFLKILDKMVEMKGQMDDSCEDDNCLWPRYHADRNKLIECDTYQGVEIKKDSSSAIYQTRFAAARSNATLQTDPVQQTRQNIANGKRSPQ